MKCLVINLDRSPARLAHMRAMFDRLEVDFEKLPAIDGAELSDEVIGQINGSNRWVRPLVRAEIGCFLSHRECWEIIAQGAEPFGAIFEDDIHISTDAQPLLRSFEWIPQGADLIKLETRNRAVTVSRRSRQVPAGRSLARLFTFHDGLGGYIVSRQCAQWLCLQARKSAAPVDHLILNPDYGIFGSLKAFQLMPSICIPDQLAGRNDEAGPRISSTIDGSGNLYESDRLLLAKLNPPHNGRVRREIGRMAAGLRRVLRGRKKIRVQYR